MQLDTYLYINKFYIVSLKNWTKGLERSLITDIENVDALDGRLEAKSEVENSLRINFCESVIILKGLFHYIVRDKQINNMTTFYSMGVFVKITCKAY